MKSQTLSVTVLLAAVAITLSATIPFSRGQATGSPDDVAIATLIAEVSAQQALVMENQAKIDEKIAQI
ncbi:MAG: hypothetical protein EOP84_16525, partial [Verrucomicrobiaceae bacterium]